MLSIEKSWVIVTFQFNDMKANNVVKAVRGAVNAQTTPQKKKPLTQAEGYNSSSLYQQELFKNKRYVINDGGMFIVLPELKMR